ncbi:spermidine/putrescine ABC transporter substrate-binding protein [Paracoccus sp. MBLB3053]|uniref:Spermidine/putrescine ABC transporter substrate-binding protein n=1 Tax=Paracoccus aurantius TaxID=3073814 RepID=A0ABU2HS25_9RHOB|nr:spermidine/putrescine ABC transporter substrate-binding protein [Paracoccus sp. MBLB3053]MDS9467853.1 spermidine/putrescine ABC transporter substrate-binding protein [Paracoccus sp. MBLB3053]
MISRPTCTALALCAAALPISAHAATELNALIWCDHADPALLEPFEQAHDVRINVKEYQGTAEALTILEQSRPGDWDLLVIDAVDVGRAVERDVLAPLPAEALPTTDFFPELVMASHNTKDGVTYAVTDKFGYNTLAYDKTKVDPADMTSLKSLWSGKYAGRIGIYDYYLPSLGLVGIAEGIPTAELGGDNIEKLREPLMALKKDTKLVADVVGSQTALATGEVDILLGGGEYLTATLHAENPNLEWIIPEEGAALWAESIAVLKDAGNPELALEFVKYVTSPEGQARLATSSCYWGMPANAKAGEHLTDEQKAVLRWDEQAEFLKRAQLYPIPSAEDDAAMQDLWTDMLQN